MKGSRQVRGNFCRQEPVSSGSVTVGRFPFPFRSREHRSRPEATGRAGGVWDSVAQKAMEPQDVHVSKGSLAISQIGKGDRLRIYILRV